MFEQPKGRAFSDTPFDAVLGALPPFRPGTVWLAGSGPGDPGMLTLAAMKGLREADVIVYDSLVSEDILSLCRADAMFEFMGKRGGRPSVKQPQINARLVALARQGLRVLRLKGGDPFVFGRGGEEALALAEAGIAFRVLSGVTAGIGGLASAGIPATHRGMTSVTAFVTGHGSNGAVPEAIDWPALNRAAPVLVFYMGLRTMPQIAAHLMAAGRAMDEPVAVVSNASIADQRILRSTLGAVAEDIASHGSKSPAIIVVGPVARLHDVLAQYQEFGQTGHVTQCVVATTTQETA